MKAIAVLFFLGISFAAEPAKHSATFIDHEKVSAAFVKGGTIYDHGQQILDALAQDRYGIAVSNLRYANPNVKAIALASEAGGPYYEASKENLIERKYPLTRIIPAVIDRRPGMPIDPKVKEFLRYILSREGQEAAVRDGRYLPITKETVAEQLKKLD